MVDSSTAGAARRPSLISKAARPRLVDRRPRAERPLSAATACWTSGPRTWPAPDFGGNDRPRVAGIFGRPGWCLSRGRDRGADFVRALVAAFAMSVFARSTAREKMSAPKPSLTCSWQLHAPPRRPGPSHCDSYRDSRQRQPNAGESCCPSPPELHRPTQAVPLVQRPAVKLRAAVRGRPTASTACSTAHQSRIRPSRTCNRRPSLPCIWSRRPFDVPS